jgi:uncharacterized membrane protein
MPLLPAFFGSLNWPSDNWLRSRQAVRWFLAAVVLVLAITPIWLGSTDPARMPFAIRVPLTLVVMAGTLALFFLWLGMWRYWARLDCSTRMTKRLWFGVLLFGFWYGSCLYYFLLYRPQVRRAATAER